jgi:hypothetical protein
MMATDRDAAGGPSRDQVRDQTEIEQARGWRHSPAEQRKDLLPGTRAWRTDHTEIMLVETPDSEESEVYLRVTDVTTGRYVQAPLAADDLEIVAHVLQLQAARLRRAAERR